MVATRLEDMFCNRLKIFDNPFFMWFIIYAEASCSLTL